MGDLDIIILNNELVDEDGLLNQSLNLDKENTYISLEINNIPRILSKMIIDRILLNSKNEYDMEKIKMIYFTSLSEYEGLMNFFQKCISKLPVYNEFDIMILKYIEEFYSISCELNLNNTTSKKKKMKIKK